MLLVSTAGAALALASTTSSAGDEQAQQDTIIVTGERLPVGIVEVQQRPGGANIVDADEYKDRVAVSLRDALAFSPGVYAQPRFGQEVRLSIRGSGISRAFHMRGLTLLQDGIPINLADDNGDFQELDPTILDHLEIYRGANAFRFGGTTLGGAINGITPTGRTAAGWRARLDGGSFETVRAQLAYGWNGPNADAWLTVTGDRSDGDRQHDHRDSLRAQGNVGFKLSSNVETRFYLSANHIDQELPGGLEYPDVIDHPGKGSFAGDQKRDIDSLRVQNRTTINLDDVGLEFGGFVNAKRLFHPIFEVFDQDSLDEGVFARIGWQSGSLDLHAGATARFGDVDSQRHVNIDGHRGALTFDADQHARTVDVYGEARLDLGEVTLVGGAIYTNGMRRQAQTFPSEVTAKAAFNQFSPRLGLIWHPANNVEIYANFSRSHELPGFIELAQVISFVPLEAQHAWTAEIGTRGKLGLAHFDLSLYRANVRNELLQFNTGPDIPASTFNAGKTLHQGIEAGLDLDLADWARLRQVYQFNDFRFRDDSQFGDNRLPVIPKHLYRAELRLGPDQWHVSPSLEWVPHGAWADYANSFHAGGYATLGLSGAVTVAKGTELFMDARNLANKKAIGDIGAVVDYQNLLFQKAIFYPIERRAFYAGVRTSW
jgi:iron complex outermembrane receptor protein